MFSLRVIESIHTDLFPLAFNVSYSGAVCPLSRQLDFLLALSLLSRYLGYPSDMASRHDSQCNA